MSRLPDCTTVALDGLLDAVGALRDDDWRLVTASCVPHRAAWTVLYHFERGERLRHLRIEVPAGGSAPSIGAHYGAAFLVENEMAELQGSVMTKRIELQDKLADLTLRKKKDEAVATLDAAR